MNKRISIALIFVFALNFMIMDTTRVTALTAKPTPERLEAPSEITLAVGESVPVTATLYYSDGSTFDAAKNGIFSYGKQIEFSNGIITGKKVGKTTLKIKAYGKIASINVTVTKTPKTNDALSEVKPIRIETPKSLTLAVGESVPLTATVYFSGGSTIDVSKGGANYSYNDTILLQGGMIIGQNSGKTSLVISVYGKTAKVNITVKEPVKEVESLQVPDTINLEVNQTAPVSATIHFSDGSSMDVSRNATFTVKNKTIVSVGDGLVIGKKGGNTTVTVKSNGKTAIINVVVAEPEKPKIPTPVRIDTNTVLTVKVGETVPITATLYFSDGSTIDAVKNGSVSWNNPCISYSSGFIKGKAAGNATICIQSNGLKANVMVTVSESSKEAVKVEVPEKVKVSVGQSVPLTATVFFSDGSTDNGIKDALYFVQDKEIISVTQGVITGKKVGTGSFKIKSHGIISNVEVEVIENEQEQPNSSNAQTLDPVIVSGSKLTKNYSWQYNDINFNWTVDIPQDLLDYNADIRNTITKYYTCGSAKERQALFKNMTPEMKKLLLPNNGDETDWVLDSKNLAYMNYLAEKLKAQATKNGWGKYETANFVLKFVQSFPHVNGNYPQCAADSLVLTSDCDTKSILYCSLLMNMGYKVALMFYKEDGPASHVSAGVALGSSDKPPQTIIGVAKKVNGLNYYEAECTSSQYDLGESPTGTIQGKTSTIYTI